MRPSVSTTRTRGSSRTSCARWSRQRVELARQGLVAGRRAARGGADPQSVSRRPSSRETLVRLVGEALAVQRLVQPVAARIAREHAPGAVGAVRPRRKAHQQHARPRIAKARHRAGPSSFRRGTRAASRPRRARSTRASARSARTPRWRAASAGRRAPHRRHGAPSHVDAAHRGAVRILEAREVDARHARASRRRARRSSRPHRRPGRRCAPTRAGRRGPAVPARETPAVPEAVKRTLPRAGLGATFSTGGTPAVSHSTTPESRTSAKSPAESCSKARPPERGRASQPSRRLEAA